VPNSRAIIKKKWTGGEDDFSAQDKKVKVPSSPYSSLLISNSSIF